MVEIRDGTILSNSSERAPTAMCNPERDRHVKGRSINARLTARHNSVDKPRTLRLSRCCGLEFGSSFRGEVADDGLLARKPNGTRLNRKRWL